MGISAAIVKQFAQACGFDLVGIAPALPLSDFGRFDEWRTAGMAAEMGYLTDYRGDLRSDPRNLLPSAKTIVCLGKLYNTEHPHSVEPRDATSGWISRYAWGADYHSVLREGLERFVERLASVLDEPFESRICVDTAPLLERSYARAAGLGWIGKNTCLINQSSGSWFFLGELLLSIALEPDSPAPDRCGSCTRCIDACPTEAIVPHPSGEGWSLDARLCISYLTIEKRGPIPAELSARTGDHLFGCDICQDVCPWNRRAPVSAEPFFAPAPLSPSLERLSTLTPEEFRALFRSSPIWRAKYEGFLRNVALAMGNSGNPEMKAPLTRLLRHPLAVVSAAAADALRRLNADLCLAEPPSCNRARSA